MESGCPRFWRCRNINFSIVEFFLGVREPGAFCSELRVLFLRDYLCNQIFGFVTRVT